MPRPRDRRREPLPWRRVLAFATLTLLILGGAVYLVQPRQLAEDTSALKLAPAGASATPTLDMTVRIDMEGFKPAQLAVPAGRAVRLRIVNPDNSMHSDGGGWHQLAIPQLGIDARIAPLTVKTILIPASPAGEYHFYCDVCCGGKENPSMQGMLVVRPS